MSSPLSAYRLFYSDGFMFAKRWQLLVNNRSKLDLIEALTWNDFGV